ncbi:RNA-binding domain-containing protein [Hydrogenimonas thermophila]|uniref:ATP-dependent DNA helicase RecG n=1 Tax=Hydrogenimonas thermophila TaxID=223786 RepID=A0A1I5P2M0_9BACT|nr:RNA-binding domain-containing protein [Hydrogenimonas thermophila]WOE69585.1 putative DNA binding domain-containing protein [Hydrogenimonas thermophila]WOE72099.1 putative DNA binding domain-containing protein [Hydrogenimonas thermophila]SFP28344.1 ATP-dependent DNA helicase RecG [Hydrogenimonas thermophila]
MLKQEIQKGESKKLELKEKLPSNEAIAKTVIAFSNTSGGKIIVGVNDKREIIGIDEDRVFEYEEKISSIVSDLCYPNILPEIYAQNIDGKVVLVVEVFRGSLLPYYLKNKGKLKGTIIRVGSTNRVADEVMITELQRQRFNKSFDEEENFEIGLDNLNFNIIYNEFEKIGKSCDYKKLKNLKLIKSLNSSDLPTNALCITLGKFDNSTIKCARFRGVTKEIFIDKKEFNKDLFSNLNNTLQFLQNHLNLFAKVEGLQLKEELEIPLIALREALLNAVIHRDYTRNSDIKVAVYDDMVEIVSPGGFPNGLTLEEVMSGRSELRNRVLANLFRELKYIESWGSGIGKIKKLCDEKGIKFEIDESGNFISIVFYRKTGEKVPNSAEKVPNIAELSFEEEKIVRVLKQNEKIVSNDVEKILNIKERRAREILSNLVKKGVLKKIGKTKGSYYIFMYKNETNI